MTQPPARKIVIQSLSGLRPELDALIEEWIVSGVKYIGVVGVDASMVGDAIGYSCISRTPPDFILTAVHGSDETLDDAVALAGLIDEVDGAMLGSTIEIIEV